MAVQGAHFGVELPQVPERDGRVVGARGEQPVIQEPGAAGKHCRAQGTVCTANGLQQEWKLTQR